MGGVLQRGTICLIGAAVALRMLYSESCATQVGSPCSTQTWGLPCSSVNARGSLIVPGEVASAGGAPLLSLKIVLLLQSPPSSICSSLLTETQSCN